MGSITRVVMCVMAAGCGRLGFDGHTAAGGDDTMAPDAAMAQMPPGLVAYWPFDAYDATGAIVDQSGNGHDAACAGGECPTLIASPHGQAAQFDGAANCLHVPTMSAWMPQAFTIVAWVQSGSGPVTVHESDMGCPSPEFQMSNGTPGLVQLDSNDAAHNNAFATASLDSAWHHVAVSWDGAIQQVFVDDACNCAVAPTLGTLMNPKELSIGCYPVNSVFFSGALDELQVYDHALSPSELGTTRMFTPPGNCPAVCNTSVP